MGAWQDMIKLIQLEEHPVNPDQHHQILHSNGVTEIVMKEVRLFLLVELTLVSDMLCSGNNMAFRVLEAAFSRLGTIYCLCRVTYLGYLY